MEENKIPSQDSVQKSSRLGDKLIIFGALAMGVIYFMVLARGIFLITTILGIHHISFNNE